MLKLVQTYPYLSRLKQQTIKTRSRPLHRLRDHLLYRHGRCHRLQLPLWKIMLVNKTSRKSSTIPCFSCLVPLSQWGLIRMEIKSIRYMTSSLGRGKSTFLATTTLLKARKRNSTALFVDLKTAHTTYTPP